MAAGRVLFFLLIVLSAGCTTMRDARARLEEAGKVVPGNRGVTSRPTTEVLFRLFRGIDVVRGLPGEPATVSRITQSQLDALEILEHPLLKDSRVRFNAPRASGRPRDRAYENWRSKNKQSPGENGNSASAIP